MPEIDPIIKTIIAEALGEGQTGMQMVAETILNRATQRGLSPEGVVTQPGQYTGYSNPGPAAVRAFNDPNVVTAAQAAWQLAQGADDPTNGANHYFNPNIAQPSWARSMTPTATYGGHAFYTDRPVTQQVAQSGNAPSPQMQSNSIQRQRDMIPSLGSGASPALQQAMAMLASSGSNPYPQTQSGDMRLMRNPMMSASAAQQQVTPYPTNQSDDMLLRRNPNVGTTIGTIPTSGGTGQMYQGIYGPFNAVPPIGANGSSTANINAQRIEQLLNRQQGESAIGGPPTTRRVQGIPFDQNGPVTGLTTQQLAALYAGGGPTRLNMNQLDRLPQGTGLASPRPSTTMAQTSPLMVGVPPLPMMASDALRARRNNTPMMAAAGMAQQGAPLGGSPLRVTVNGAGSYNAQPQQQQVAQPVGFTPVQTLQQQGLSNAQAYELLNSINRGSLGVGDRITGAGTQASSGASANSIYG